MCGITGFIDFNFQSTLKDLENMTNSIAHRGPDSNGHLFLKLTNCTVGMGHRRLSILDLSESGKQPMQFEDLYITYNGEVYNYAEIKDELLKHGYRFTSGSDTNVLLRAFSKWNIDAVHKFNGMFAFAILDKKKEVFHIFRDRTGIKPLYYFKKGNVLLFASELKALHEHPAFTKEINLDALALYFQFGYIPSPHTIFHHTFKLNPGSYLEIDLKTGKHTEQVYWNVLDYYKKPKLTIPEKVATEKLHSILRSACNYRMVSDVPVGLFLSGGYDSTAVAALLQHDKTEKIKTFTIGFHESKLNEAPFAKEIAKNLQTDHTEFYCTEKDAQEIIPLLPDIFDEPFADSSSIPTYIVSKLARQHVKVALSADAGDETFAGYTKYGNALSNWNKVNWIPAPVRKTIGNSIGLFSPLVENNYKLKREFDTVKTLLTAKNSNPGLLMKLMSERLNNHELKKLFKKDFSLPPNSFDLYESMGAGDPLDKLLAIDYKTYLPDDILTKVDRATMAVSLEGREPLLDYRIIEFAAQLPSDLKIKNGIKKYLLKEIVHQYVPKNLVDRPKMGFAIPIKEWCRNDLKDYIYEFLDPEKIEKQGLFNAHYILERRSAYLNGKDEHWEFIWFMLVFQLWYRRWIV